MSEQVIESSQHAIEPTELLCPLCDYNLRGLVEPRCPECGAKFDWDELRNPARRLHPYLFEHHPERNVRSFFRTLAGGLRPGRFWKTLLPVQPSRPRRLIAYWLLCLLLAAMSAVVEYGVDVWRFNELCNVRRTAYASYYGGTGHGAVSTPTKASVSEVIQIIRRSGSVQQFIEDECPRPPTVRFFKDAAGLGDPLMGNPYGQLDFVLRMIFIQLALAVVWPWAAALIMLLFRASMKRASVRPIHLLRVTIYTSDLIVWVGLLWIGFIVFQLAEMVLRMGLMPAILFMRWQKYMGVSLMLLIALITTWRLGCGIGRYLRFRHAMAMAISVQIIFVLLTIQLLVMFG